MSGFPYVPPPELLQAIETCRTMVLATHENPDADGLGSLLAFGLALSEHGRSVHRLDSGVLPANLVQLPGLDRVLPWNAPDGARGDVRPDLVVLFDCHRRARLGAAAAQLEGAPFVVAIDHHPLDPRGSDVDLSWLVEDAPSTSMLVHSILHELGDLPLDADQASNLYAGLLTDTGGFRHANTTRDALLSAADLVHRGADPSALADQLLYRRRPQALQLTGEVLLNTRYPLDGRIALMVVEQELLARTGARFDESESLASQLTSIEGVQFGALLRQVGPRSWRVSLRSNGLAPVDDVARGFGGGGHHRAAAYTAEGSREDVESTLVDALARALDPGPRGEHS